MTQATSHKPRNGRRCRAVGHLSLIILLLPALQPLLTADFTCGYDNTFHLWRAVELEHLLQQGVLLSRWAPDMANGYGYPLFNFAAPASAYGVAFLRLLGLPWPWALNLAFAAGWILSAYTMYLFVSDLYRPTPPAPGDRFNHHAGLVAAVLYTYAPFHAYDVFYRGSLSQSSAWLFPPLILWALRRADRRAGFAATALGFAGLILTHNAFALLFAPLLLAYTLVVGWKRGRTPALWGGLALLVGLGLSALFWLPALAELGFVHSERLSGAWVFQYADNFLPLEQLFSPPHIADPTLINDWPARGLGIIPTALAGIGLVTALRNPRRRLPAAFFAGALTLYLFLTLPISQPAWDALPLLQRVQFPWRLVGPATLCAAVLASGLLATQRQTHRPTLVAAALILLLVLGNLGWFYPRHCSPAQDISTAGMIAWERATDTVGTTAKGEYLPTWVHRMPDDSDSTLDAAYAAGEPIVRLPSSSLPEGTRISRANYGPMHATVELEASTPFQARYLAFYYPGWRVTVDGNPVPITPTEPDGLISFDIPDGHHTIDVDFAETGFRLGVDALSLVSLAALVATIILRPLPQPAHPSSTLDAQSSNWSLILALVLLIVKVSILDRTHTPLRRPNLVDGHLHDVDVATRVTFDDEFVLLGYDALPESVASDGQLELKTYWRALRPSGPDYGVTVNVVDQNESGGHYWNTPGIHPPRWHRTPPPVSTWPPDQYASVALSVPLLPGTPPGTYSVEIVAFDRDTLIPLTAHDADGHALGPALSLGQITVVPPRHPIDPDTLGIRHRLDTSLGPLTLLGADLDRDQAAPGDPILLTTLWRVEQQVLEQPDLTTRLTLLAPDGLPAAEFDLPPTVSGHPTSNWKPGEVWRGQHLLHLPARLDDGDYTWNLALHPISSTTRLPLSLTISAPERSFVPPPVDIEIHTRLGDVATLIGADVDPIQPSTRLTVTLVWRAETETRVSYNVFLHLIGPDGALAAQSDGIPASWSRPTTGWTPGEIITDVHALTLPTDRPVSDYTLLAGLYVPGGERLTAPDGTDAIALTTITIPR
jgi:hypothetical protein